MLLLILQEFVKGKEDKFENFQFVYNNIVRGSQSAHFQEY